MRSTQLKENSKTIARILKLIAREGNNGARFTDGASKIQIFSNSRHHSFHKEQFAEIESAGYVKRSSERICLTETGVIILKKLLHPDAVFEKLDRAVGSKKILIDGELETVTVNLEESPLARLFSRRSKTGASYLNEMEFRAGEKLRLDFEKGQLQPHISANWSANMNDGGGGSGFGKADISDMAIDARGRVNEAIKQLGPDLSGVAIDVCCFLKGIELVERERQWPRRSAKLMLKTALAMLARHYGFDMVNQRRGEILSWGTRDFRPDIAGRSS